MDNYWSTELFEQNIKAMNYMQLADWLIACRSHIKRTDYDSYEDYTSEVAYFCSEWEDFYTKHEEEYDNKSVFRSEKFKKALLYAQVKNNYRIRADFGAAKEDFIVDTYENLQKSIFSEHTVKEIQQTFDGLYELIQKVFQEEQGFKQRLHKVVSTQLFNDIVVYVRVFNDKGKQIKAATYKEALKLCEQEKNYTVEVVRKKKKVGYYQSFKEYDIATTVYTEYISPNYCEQEFNKKIFINLAFALCLNKTDAEKFLKFNGYSISNQTRQFDVICEKSFRIGFGREYTIALIDKFNEEIKARYPVCKLIPNITKNRKTNATV